MPGSIKRSEVNKIMREADEFIRSFGYVMPPFAYWSPSEFSRLRLQFNQDKSQIGLTDNQVFLQYIFSLGTHGAHKF